MAKLTNKEILAQTEKLLRLKNYSRKTITAYVGHQKRFMEYAKTEISLLNSEQVTDYLYYLTQERQLSATYIIQTVSALKVAYNEVLKTGISIDFPRIKQAKKLPVILSKVR